LYVCLNENGLTGLGHLTCD